MRLLTRKIYRAFPELDKFEDEVCVRYVKNAKHEGADVGCALTMAVVFVSVMLWFASIGERVYIASKVLLESMPLQIFDSQLASGIAYIVSMTGFVWFPWISALLTRDIWLRRVVREQIVTVRCTECKYSLIGLPLYFVDEMPYVDCPECGKRTMLYDNGLTEADIDPTLVQESA